MSVLNSHINIPKKVDSEDDLDFFYLRKKGIEYIKTLGKAFWTDFNTHDPGITMLEMLCYAISDLGMRMDLPIEDLLTTKDENKNIDKQFFKASAVLPSSPVTALDYRKLFIDIEGVKNCWLVKHKKTVYVNCKDNKISYNPKDFEAVPQNLKKQFVLKGLYDLYVDFESSSPSEIKKVKDKIRIRYNANRNLCEDIVNIIKIDEFPIKICASIEVDTEADEEMVHALITNSIGSYLATTVNFYSIKQMMDKGFSSLEIFDGPVLEHGFIDTNELIKADLRSEIRLSDIMKIIMEVPDVIAIKDISLGNCNDSEIDLNQWLLCLREYQKPIMCTKSAFSYSKGLLPLNINKAQVKIYLDQIQAQKDEIINYASHNKELEIPRGKYLQTDIYTTIQNDFPQTYGIGEVGLPSRASTQRLSQAKQLKGYLLFFDQILGSYFKQLGQVSELLSVSGSHTKTFFTQAIKDIEGIEELVNDYPTTNDESLTDILFEKQDNTIERRNKILDHLLARFAERFSEYVFINKTIYGSAADEVVLRNKEDFLKDYKIVSRERGNAFNYYKQPATNLWDTNNVSGAEKRISRLIGIKDYSRRNVSNSFVEIYQFKNTKDQLVYKWRIRNAEHKIILSSTTEYFDTSAANNELYYAVLQIIQTREYKVKEAFENVETFPLVIDNIQVHQTESGTGQYSYDIINPEIKKESNPDRIVAKRYNYYKTQNEVKQSILNLIKFIKERFTEEGMFLIEHIMLRPEVYLTDVNPATLLPICTEECTSCEPLDSYSFRVSIVLPGYTLRFSNTDFRAYIEKVIKEELPAHVVAKICWVGYRETEMPNPLENDLLQFEKTYKHYLLAKTNLDQEQPEPELIEFIKAYTSLNNVYPTGRLFDCGDENEKVAGKIILGKTNLGSL